MSNTTSGDHFRFRSRGTYLNVRLRLGLKSAYNDPKYNIYVLYRIHMLGIYSQNKTIFNQI